MSRSSFHPSCMGSHGNLARQSLSPRCDLRRRRHQLRRCSPRPHERVELCLVRRRGRRAARRADRRSTGSSGTCYLPRVGPGSATATGCTGRTTRQPASAATRRSCCSTPTPRRSRARSTGTSRCSPTTSTTPTPSTTTDSLGHTMLVRGGQPVLRLGQRPAAAPRVPRDGDLRGPRQGPDDDPPRRTRGDPRHVRRHSRTRRSSSTSPDLGVTAIELMPVHQFVQDTHPARQGAGELLGLQHHRLLRPAQRLRLGAASAASRCRSSRRWSGRCTRRTSR